MKKIILSITMIALGCVQQVNAQVGINTATPTATLDVTAKNATGTTTTPEGLLIPRVDRQRAQSMTSVPTSTLVYVNSIATGTATGTAANMDAVGYYYYNGTAWAKLGADTNTNIYTNDGTLSGNRTVTQGANTLAFTGSATNAFSVDGTTLSVDASNNRVGVGTSAPGEAFSVVDGGNSNQYNGIASFLANNLTAGVGIGWQGIQSIGSSANVPLNLNSKGTGHIVMQTSGTTGNVGINTTAPTSTLDVTAKNATGTVTTAEGLLIPRVDRQRAQSMTGVATSTLVYVNSIATGTATGTAANIDAIGYYYYNGTAWAKLGADTNTNIYTNDGTLSGNRTVTQGANTLAFTGSATNAFSVDGTTLSVDAANNRVGVGTSAPEQALSVIDGSSDSSYGIGTFTHSNLTAGVGLGWQGLQSRGTNTDIALNLNAKGAGNILLQTTGNIGAGTTTPQRKLHVAGGLQVTNELNVGGSATAAGSAGTSGQYLVSKGAGAAPAWESPAGIVPTSNGTIIAINGNLVVAQEITVQMTADYSDSGVGNALPIGNLGNEIIDNENKYTSTTSSNSFQVSADGTYQIMMNIKLELPNGGTPVAGIWDNTDNKWVARNNAAFSEGHGTITVITSIPMQTSHVYSFRTTNTVPYVVKHLNAGSTGSGPVTQVSVKRLK